MISVLSFPIPFFVSKTIHIMGEPIRFVRFETTRLLATNVQRRAGDIFATHSEVQARVWDGPSGMFYVDGCAKQCTFSGFFFFLFFFFFENSVVLVAKSLLREAD